MNIEVREKLLELTTKCDILSESGKYVECIDIMEEIVSLKKSIYGMDHPEFTVSTEKLCEFLNLAAMIYLQKEKFDLCLDFLRKAELVARHSLQYKSTTYNNLACFYRRTGKIRTALTYLIQALELELKIEQPRTLADTHLNLCAVLSQLDRHEDALQHVMLSIILLQDEFLQTVLPKAQEEHVISDERLAVLAIAYHNLGVEFEHLKRFEEAVKIYKKALKISTEHLSENDQLIQNLTRVVNSATEQIAGSKKSHSEASKQRYDQEMPENKRDIYKDFARQVERVKALPKLAFKNNRQSVNSSHDGMRQSGQQHFGQQVDRGFATRKRPRYYRSHVVAPTQNIMENPTDAVQSKVPVSSELQEFYNT